MPPKRSVKPRPARVCQFQRVDIPGNRWVLLVLDTQGRVWMRTSDEPRLMPVELQLPQDPSSAK